MTTLEEKMGYCFSQAHLLEQALTHKSYYNECEDKSIGHNEKLEFLGDAVLDLSLGHLLYEKFPDLDEGHLSKIRASLVNEQFLTQVAKDLELDKAMKLGRGEARSGGHEKPRLLSSVLEALIGAYYLDADFKQVHQWVAQIFDQALTQVDLQNHFSTDFKTRLQERTQEEFKIAPVYKIIKEEGPDHDKVFCVEVFLNDTPLAIGEGRSKKQAEQNAAQKALENLS